ncbi:hypothetical protein M408DRAFT_16338 [Serendipita vermifera MAFF 305830]|uniref:Uncharacterized protein n=1 Tax=Serendipita vermifera MAFF 305830 TaxID=933852 RepID=A0A0C3B8H7_SERVB|nr:hypothetical protein M408DRAFT_16338 [Serendipita vermifera MAFF 305830]
MSTLKVSIPDHLGDTLNPLIGILPTELENLVVTALEGTEILYSILADVSKWAYTEEGKQKLESKDLNFRDYDRINLLAGTVTGPASRLPPPEPKPEPWEVAQDEKNTRRAIAALVNALFSVVGVGAAVWWASKTTGWSDTTRISFSILGGLVTAIAEGGLFAVYYNRREDARKYREKRRERQKERLMSRYQKKLAVEQAKDEVVEAVDDKDADNEASVTNLDAPQETDTGPLRRRKKGGEKEDAVDET